MQPNTHTHPRFLRKSAEKALQKSTPFGSKTASFLVISTLGPRVCQKRPQSCPWAPKVLKRRPNDGPKVPKDLKKEPKWSPKVHKGLKRVWKWSPKVAKSLTISSKRLCNDTPNWRVSKMCRCCAVVQGVWTAHLSLSSCTQST